MLVQQSILLLYMYMYLIIIIFIAVLLIFEVPIIASIFKYKHSKHKTVTAFHERNGPLF